MKTAILLSLTLTSLALAGEAPSGSESTPPSSVSAAPAPSNTAHPEEGHISITSYDAPWSSGESTWTVPTTVSYETGSNYTSMLTGSGSTATGSTTMATSKAAGSETSAAATGSQSVEPLTGVATEVGVGMGVLVMAALANLL